MPDRTCTIDGCERNTRTGKAAYCEMHYLRFKRHGDPLVVLPRYSPGSGEDNHQWRGQDIAYSTAHSRVTAARGRAAQHQCAHCHGKAAQEWAYDGSDEHELVSDRRGSLGMRYSADPAKYLPLCSACHRAFDGNMPPMHWLTGA